MSIAELTVEGTRLIEVFQEKETDIEDAVAAAIATLGYPGKTFYIDSIAGDDTATGADSSHPFETLAHALDIIGGTAANGWNGLNAELVLAADGAYTLPTKELSLSGCFVRFYTYEPRSAGTPTITQPNGAINSSGDLPGFYLRNSVVNVIGAKLVTATTLPDPVRHHEMFRLRSSGGMGALQMFTASAEINDAPLMGTVTGLAQLGISQSTITRPTSSVPVLNMRTGGCAVLQVESATVPSADWRDDLIAGIVADAADVPINVLSNLDLTTP